MSTHKSLKDVINELEYWIRLATFLHEPLKNSLLGILHNDLNNPNYNGLPRDPSRLCISFQTTHKNKIDLLIKKNILKQDQIDLLRPINNTKSFSDKYDVTLIVILIRNCCTNLTKPLNGWNCKLPPVHDNSISANVVRAREWRNFIHHNEPIDITQQIFNDKWKEGTDIIKALGYGYDCIGLKSITLDPKQAVVLDSLKIYVDKLEKDQHHNVNVITDLDDRLAWMQSEIQKLRRELDDSSKTILPEALEILSENIGAQWKLLAKQLEISDNDIGSIETEQIPIGMKMSKCIEKLERPLHWTRLKSVLRRLARKDIIEQIKKETLLTLGIRDASLKLKNTYTNDLFNSVIRQPIIRNEEQIVECVPREEAYVELAILEAKEVDRIWNHSERDFHIAQSHLNRTSINIDDILLATDNFVIIRGIAGIGKSTMIDSYVLKWAKSRILNDKKRNDLKIDFLFKFSCRDINATEGFKSLKELLKLTFPEVFNEISVEDLEELSSRVLIVIDGVDELKSIDKMNKVSHQEINTKHRHLKLIKDLMDTTSSIFLKGHKTIVTGRPEACQLLTSMFTPLLVEIKRVEICGFNTENVEKYVTKFFQDTQRRNDVLLKIRESENLTLMATIPIYLWVICNIYQESILDRPVETTTELCIYSCLLFIRNHLKALGDFTVTTLYDMVNNIDIQHILISLSSLSIATLYKRKVVFSEKDIKMFKMPIKIEQTGFIVKHCYGDMKGSMYQFKHLVLQEFLSGLHIYLSNGMHKYSKKTALRNCIPIVAGLTGIKDKGQKNVLYILLRNLKVMQYKQTKWFASIPAAIRSNSKKMPAYLEVCLKKKISGLDLIIDSTCSNLLSSLYEYQGKYTKRTIRDISKIRVEVRNLLFHHDIRNALFVLRQLEINIVDHMSFFNVSNNPFPINLIDLVKLSLTAVNQQKRLILCCGKSMSVISHSPTQNEKIIIVRFIKNSNISAHQSFLLTLLHAVNNVVLMYSLDRLYPSIKGMVDSLNLNITYDEYPIIQLNKPTVHQIQMFVDSIRMKGRLESPTKLCLKHCSLNDNHIRVLSESIFYFKVVDLTSNFLSRKSLDQILDHILCNKNFSSFSLKQVKLNITDFSGSNVQHSIYVQRKHAKVKSLVTKKELLEKNVCRYPFYVKPIGRRGYLCSGGTTKLDERVYYTNLSIIVSEPETEYECLTHYISLINECYGTRYLHLLDLTQISFQTFLNFDQLTVYIPHFKIVTLKNNRFVSPEHIKVIANSLSNKEVRSRLKVLDLSYCDLCNEHIVNLLPSLNLIHELNLQGNRKLSLEIIQEMIGKIANSSYEGTLRLQKLDLSDCGMMDEHLESFLSILPQSVTLIVDLMKDGNAYEEDYSQMLYSHISVESTVF